MTLSDLQNLLRTESNRVDWKSTGDPEKIVKTLSAYANDFEEAGSGSVVCGVEEVKSPSDGTTARIVGITRTELENLKDKVFQLCRSLVSPSIAPQFDSVAVSTDKEILLIWTAASSDVHSFRGDVFIRLDDKVAKATVGQIAELSLRKAHLDWLAQPCPGATVQDLDFFALEELARRLRFTDGPAHLLRPGARVISSALPLTSQVETPKGVSVVPSRFAILLAGSEPQHFFPGAFISVTKYAGTTRSDGRFQPGEILGPIPYLVQKAMGILETEAMFITDKSQDVRSGLQNTRRYSIEALQEILINSLAHRSYQSDLSTKLNIFADRIEFENPGGAPAALSIDNLKSGTTRWRNPSLARYLFELGLAQERGSGIPKAIRETFALTGTEPVFHTDDWFNVTIPAYRPPLPVVRTDAVGRGAGLLVISIGFGGIDLDIIRRSNQEFQNLDGSKLESFSHAGVVSGEQWHAVAGDLRTWLRDRMESPAFREFHLFYRGPVAFGPLIGAIAVGRRPMVVYFFDEESGCYSPAYRIDRNLIQAD